MITKDSFLKSCQKIPFAKDSVDGFGECGLVLFREGELTEMVKLPQNDQIAQCVIGENGERIFSDDDIESCIKDKMTTIVKNRIIAKVLEVNGLGVTQEDVKKN
jgi:hypothetical protein